MTGTGPDRPAPDDPVQAELTELWGQVGHVARARVALVTAAVTALQHHRPDAPARQADAIQECHKLIGSLDSFGRRPGSRLAAEVAALLEQPDPDLDLLSALVGQLDALVAADLDGTG